MLKLPDGSVIELTEAPTHVTSATDPNVYRYPLPSTLALLPGNYEVEFIPGSFSDTDGLTNQAESESFTVGAAQGELAGPKADGQIDVRALNESGYITVRLRPVADGKLNLSTILDDAPEFTLSGFAARSVAIEPVPEQVDDYTFKYRYTGAVDTGAVEVNFLAGAFADTDGNQSIAATQSFTVVGPTVNLLVRTRDLQVLNNERYIDVWFDPSSGAELNAASITDSAPEFTLVGAAAANVVVDGAAVLVDDGHTYRYSFTGQFGRGPVSVSFLRDGWTDSSGLSNVAESETLTVVGSTARRRSFPARPTATRSPATSRPATSS
ncbi:MAG TPA: hypothetical protein PLV92_03055 [Pirellulaceae bacterium]|nr:hypothetical protein [Pirellulaceae bacterium]